MGAADSCISFFDLWQWTLQAPGPSSAGPSTRQMIHASQLAPHYAVHAQTEYNSPKFGWYQNYQIYLFQHIWHICNNTLYMSNVKCTLVMEKRTPCRWNMMPAPVKLLSMAIFPSGEIKSGSLYTCTILCKHPCLPFVSEFTRDGHLSRWVGTCDVTKLYFEHEYVRMRHVHVDDLSSEF